MKAAESETTLGQDLVTALRYWLSGRRGLIIAAGGLAIAGIGLGWPWLLAAGAVPILLSLAPCLIMCALGLCMMKSCSKQGQSDTARSAPLDNVQPDNAHIVSVQQDRSASEAITPSSVAQRSAPRDSLAESDGAGETASVVHLPTAPQERKQHA